MSQTAPAGIRARRLADLVSTIDELRAGAASSTCEGTDYVAADLPALYALAERWQVKAAIEAITSGAQSYEIEGMSYTRASLSALVALDRQLTQQSVATARNRAGTAGIRYGVPY